MGSDSSAGSDVEKRAMTPTSEMTADVLMEQLVKSEYSNEELVRLRTWICDTISYFVFLLIFSLVVYLNRPDDSSFYFTDQLRNVFLSQELPPTDSQIKKTFMDVGQPQEFQQWLQDVFIPNVMPTTYYNGQPIPQDRLRYVNYYGYLVGVVRIRQHRTQITECDVPDLYKDKIINCYPKFDIDTMDTQPFGPNGTYKYTAPSPDQQFDYYGQVTHYPPGGYIVDLPVDYQAAADKVAKLAADRWLDEQTRVVIVEVIVYNPNLNVFCLMRMSGEFPAGGNVIPSYSFRTQRLFLYYSSYDWVVLTLEMIFVCFILYYVAEECREIFSACTSESDRSWRAYFVDDGWNYLDLLNLAIFIAAIALRIVWVVKLGTVTSSETFKSGTDWVDLTTIGDLRQNETYLVAVNMLLLWIKIFKYLADIPHVGELVRTLQVSAWDTILFLIMFFLVFLGFAQNGFINFSTDLWEYRNLSAAMQSLGRILMGDFDYFALVTSNRVLGPIFFFGFVFLCFIVLMNMFIAIINDAYKVVRDQQLLTDQENRRNRRMREFLFETPIEAGGLYLSYWQTLKAAFRARKEASLIELLETGRLDKNKDNKLSQDELAEHLSKENLETVLREYDVNHDHQLDTEEVRKLIEDLQQEKKILEREISALITAEEKLESEGYLNERGHKIIITDHDLKGKVIDFLRRVRKKGNGDSALMYLKYSSQFSPADVRRYETYALSGQTRDIVRAPNKAMLSLLEEISQLMSDSSHKTSNTDDKVSKAMARLEEMDVRMRRLEAGNKHSKGASSGGGSSSN